MSTDITTFVFPVSNHEVRSLTIDGEPWFVAKDVCDVLELGNVSAALHRLDVTEKGINSIDTPGGAQRMGIVSESGLYTLIIRSDKPNAVDFRRWVTGEVLPSIRRTGSYSLIARKDEQITTLMQMLVETRQDMTAIRQDVAQLVAIAERNERKLATHDLLVASELNFTMRETGHILGFRDVRKFTATLRETGVLIKQRYAVVYGGETKQRYRNTPRAQWHHCIEVKTQFSGANLVTVPYAKPSAMERLHAHLTAKDVVVPPLPSVDEQRAIVAELRRRSAIEPRDDDFAID